MYSTHVFTGKTIISFKCSNDHSLSHCLRSWTTNLHGDIGQREHLPKLRLTETWRHVEHSGACCWYHSGHAAASMIVGLHMVPTSCRFKMFQLMVDEEISWRYMKVHVTLTKGYSSMLVTIPILSLDKPSAPGSHQLFSVAATAQSCPPRPGGSVWVWANL